MGKHATGNLSFDMFDTVCDRETGNTNRPFIPSFRRDI